MHSKHSHRSQRSLIEAIGQTGAYGSLDIHTAVSLVTSLKNQTGCSRGKVGCAVYDFGGKLVACSFNDNVPTPGCDFPDAEGGCGCLHAEIRALTAAREKNSGSPYCAVVSRAPCVQCSKALIWAGVRALIFTEESRPWPQARPIWDNLSLKWHYFPLTDVPA